MGLDIWASRINNFGNHPRLNQVVSIDCHAYDSYQMNVFGQALFDTICKFCRLGNKGRPEILHYINGFQRRVVPHEIRPLVLTPSFSLYKRWRGNTTGSKFTTIVNNFVNSITHMAILEEIGCEQFPVRDRILTVGDDMTSA